MGSYAAYNAYYVLTTGDVLYWFMTWEDFTAVIITFGMIGSVNAFYYLFLILSRAMKPQMAEEEDGMSAQSRIKKQEVISAMEGWLIQARISLFAHIRSGGASNREGAARAQHAPT